MVHRASLDSLALLLSIILLSHLQLTVSSPSSSNSNSTIFVLYRSYYGNLNNQLFLHRQVYQAVRSSPHAHRLVLISGETPFGEYLIEDYFQGWPGIQSIRTRDFFARDDAREIIASGLIYVDDHVEYQNSLEKFYMNDRYYFRRLGIKPPMPRIMTPNLKKKFKNVGYCRYHLEYFTRALDNCLQDTYPCRVIMLPALFNNHDNCTRFSRSLLDATRLIAPNKRFQRLITRGLDSMQSRQKPIVALHLRFLPYGEGKKWYKSAGDFKEGKLPNNFHPERFVEETLDTWRCLETSNGWVYPTAVYLLGWPSVVDTFTPLFTNKGIEVFSYNRVYGDVDLEANGGAGMQLFRALLDEFTAAQVRYFMSMRWSTLSIWVAEYRLATGWKGNSQFLPDMLPNYGRVHLGSMRSPCQVIQPLSVYHVTNPTI